MRPRAGLPVNFFRANPDLLGGANVTGNGGYTRYNSLQIDLRKRLSHGLQFQGSYVVRQVAIVTNRLLVPDAVPGVARTRATRAA